MTRQHDPKPSPRRWPGPSDILGIVRKDFAIAVALLVIAASLLVGPWMVFGRQPVLMVAGGVLTAAALAGFLVLVWVVTSRWKV